MTTNTDSATPVQPIMRMGCTKDLITYRRQGQETVCLQSPSHGVQQLAGFNPAIGDVIGVDDILELTTAQTDLSDVARYITSAVSAAGTTLFFDPTGEGLQGSPFAVLQGVDTTVAALVADGGMKYIPDAISVKPTFDTPLTLRPAGLETVDLLSVKPGIGPQEINGFDPTKDDVLQLRAILNPTTALPDLSNIEDYVSATTVDGNTILSVDTTGGGHVGVAFAELNGVSLTLDQLLADKALAFTPSAASAQAAGGQVFQFRPEGDEIAELPTIPAHAGFATLEGFSLVNDDGLGVARMLAADHISADMANIAEYISAAHSAGSTSLWFDPSGSGQGGGTEFALLKGATISVAELVSHNAFHLS